MAEIRADVTQVQRFYDSNNAAYKETGSECSDALSYMKEMQRSLEDVISEAKSQASGLRECASDAERKIYSISSKCEYYDNEAQRIYNAGEWVKIEDLEGNVIDSSYVFDTSAYREAKRKGAEYAERLQEARRLKAKAESYYNMVINFVNYCEGASSTFRSHESEIYSTARSINETMQGNAEAVLKSLQKLVAYTQAVSFKAFG
ncbi:MAG: hypothetical protein FWD49_05450 [Firmicutes bacterium]|nr:hypothetical protein [Bacillota bacterium]